MDIFEEIGEVIRTKNYVIMQDLEFQEVETSTTPSAGKALYWVTEFYGEHYHEPEWRRYEYKILDSQGALVTRIHKNGWNLNRIYTTGGAGSVVFQGADPKGRFVQKTMNGRIKGIVEAIAFLNELSQFSSWEEYQLCAENEKLRKTLNALLVEKNRLESLLQDAK